MAEFGKLAVPMRRAAGPDASRIATTGSKFEDDSCRDPQISLALSKEIIVNGIQLKASGHAFDELVVHASSHREREAGVGVRNTPAGIGLMAEPHE